MTPEEREAVARARVEARIAEAIEDAPALPPEVAQRIRELVLLTTAVNPKCTCEWKSHGEHHARTFRDPQCQLHRAWPHE